MSRVVDELVTRLRYSSNVEELRKNRRELGGFKGEAKATTGVLGDLRRSMVEAFAARKALDGLRDVGRFIFETNRGFEVLKVRLATVEGSAEAANRRFAWLADFAKNTPFSVEGLTEAFVSLKSVGIDPTSEQMTAFADISAGMGRDITEFSQAVRGALTGEFEMLKGFGIVARVEGDRLAVTFDGQTRMIQRSSDEIIGLLTEIGQTKFAGGALAQMSTLDGVISNLQDSAQLLALQIGEAGLNEALKELLAVVGDAIGTGSEFGDILGLIAAEGVRMVKDFLEEAVDWFKKLKREDIVAWFDRLKTALTTAWEVAGALADVFSWLVEKLGGTEKAIQILLPTLLAMKIGLGGIHAAAFAAGIALSQAFGEENQKDIEEVRRGMAEIRDMDRARGKALDEARHEEARWQDEQNRRVDDTNKKLTEGFAAGLFTPGAKTKKERTVEVEGAQSSASVEVEELGFAKLSKEAEAFNKALKDEELRAMRAASAAAKASGGDPKAASSAALAAFGKKKATARAAFSEAIAAGLGPGIATKEGLAVTRQRAPRAGEKALEKEKKKEKKRKPGTLEGEINSRIEELAKEAEMAAALKARLEDPSLSGRRLDEISRTAGAEKKDSLLREVKRGNLEALGGKFSRPNQLMAAAGLGELANRATPPVITINVTRIELTQQLNAPMSFKGATFAADAATIGRVIGPEVAKQQRTALRTAASALETRQRA